MGNKQKKANESAIPQFTQLETDQSKMEERIRAVITGRLRIVDLREHRTTKGTDRVPRPLCRVGVWKENIADKAVEVAARGDELTKSAAGWSKRIEFINGNAALGICTPEIRNLLRKLSNNPGLDRIVDARTNLNVAGIETNLP